MCPFELRPHHGLCLRFFRGEGYSVGFVDNMKAVVADLEKNPTVRLVSGADRVCQCCPHRVGEQGCSCDDKVKRYDGAVIALCGLSYDRGITWEAFSQRIETDILSKGLRQQVCGDCQWTNFCK